MPEPESKSVCAIQTGRWLRPPQRLMARAGRFLLTWGTPVAIGLFLGSVACRTSSPAAAKGRAPVHASLPPR